MNFDFSLVDIAIVVVMLVSVVTGFSRGFVRELFAIGLWGIAIFTSLHYSPVLGGMLKPWIAQDQLRSIIAFVAFLAFILLVGGLIVSTISFLIHKSGLSGTDRILGMVFGILRAIFVVALLFVVLDLSGIQLGSYQKQSKLYPQFTNVIAWVQSLIPNWMKQIKNLDLAAHEVELNQEVKPVTAFNEIKFQSAYQRS